MGLARVGVRLMPESGRKGVVMNQVQSSSHKQSSRLDCKAEILIGSLVSLVAIAAILVSRKFPSTGLVTDIGSARFPLIYASVLIVLSVILIVRNWRKLRQDGATAEPGCAGEEAKPRHLRTALGIAATIASLILMPWLGYALVTVVYLSCLMWLMGMRSKWLNPTVALCVTALLYFVFSMGLHVPLPVGSLFE